MWRLLITGAFIRWCAALPIVSTMLAPRLIGTDNFGIAATIMALPYLVQGLLEPIIVTTCIATLTETADYARLARMRREVGIATLIFAGATYLFSTWYLGLHGIPAGHVYGLECALYLILAVVNTWLIGLCYAGKMHRTLMSGYAAGGIAQFCTLLALRGNGVGAFLFSLLSCQIAIVSVLGLCPAARQGLIALMRAPYSSGDRPDYFSPALQRTPYLLLNSGSVLLAGLLTAPDSVAALRISLSLAGVMAYLIPISPQLIQATLTSSAENNRGGAFRLLVMAFVGFCGLSFVMYVLSPVLISRFLMPGAVANVDAKLFLALPFFHLIQPVSAYLYATRQRTQLVWPAIACGLAFFAGAIAADPAWSFLLGSAAHISTAFGLGLYGSRRTERYEVQQPDRQTSLRHAA